MTTPPQRPDIARDLINRATTAREHRSKLLRGLLSEAEISMGLHIDHANALVLRRVMGANGWPGRSLVGEDGAEAAWQLALRADTLPDFQRLALRLLTTAVEHGEATIQQWAHLHDRCSINAGHAQLYGTQHRLGPDGVEALPIREPEHLDARRVTVGLPPFTAAQHAVRLRHGREPETGVADRAETERVATGAAA
ncbi:DUF6624 domain-containing protein [Streptoverticillium reticulum]|uniref:DUF6624 domain-containing protein n=1 Tax=Streptoverticillium reticulum TaxID=1433415 RepID=UPI0039BFE85C